MDYSFWDRLTGSKQIAHGNLTPRCDMCKTRTQMRGAPRLFLLPVYQDNDYTPSADYYGKNCRPILHVRDIPVGQRACRMWQLVCPQCGAQAVLVVDFLMVRGQELTEKLEVCDYYAPLTNLLNGSNTEITHTASSVQTFGYTETAGTGRRR